MTSHRLHRAHLTSSRELRAVAPDEAAGAIWMGEMERDRQLTGYAGAEFAIALADLIQAVLRADRLLDLRRARLDAFVRAHEAMASCAGNRSSVVHPKKRA
ncbi:MAG TPA: hypothetical protein VNJ04_08110 [Gemmatimonadaceae bacterium]|nr:hypothetical protein [Gemmatimonadaceae bacterium]